MLCYPLELHLCCTRAPCVLEWACWCPRSILTIGIFFCYLKMERVAVLRLDISQLLPRRKNADHRYEEDDTQIAVPSTLSDFSSSPRKAFSKEAFKESPLGEVRAAVPFVWESIPGTPKRDLDTGSVDAGGLSDGNEETRNRDLNLSSSSGGPESPSWNFSNDEFECRSTTDRVAEPSMSTTEEKFINGRSKPLALPPRLQAVKQLRNSDFSRADDSFSGSFKGCHSPQSPPLPRALKAEPKLILCGFPIPVEGGQGDVIILGMQERKQRLRSFSPLRLINRESSEESHHSSETYFCSDSVSSASSSSSSSSSSSGSGSHADSYRNPWDSPEEKKHTATTLRDFMLPCGELEDSKTSGINPIVQAKVKPRIVESRRELLKKNQESAFTGEAKIDGLSGTRAPQSQHSRSITTSRLTVSPSIGIHGKSSRKEHMGRALFANRFGMVCNCLGMTPDSP
nr:uncharacterized protein LOC112281525 isoform X1 [Physcomitrium patens]|eukprot:XP_024373913.1 uncharacterized protein LOC112281525 isoform X1 [Physcomitrella patens]